MNFIKSVDHFFSQLINTLFSLGKIVLKSKRGVDLPKATNDTCIVLGNGPSLKTTLEKHSTILLKTDLLCVNNFATANEYELLKPSYYLMLDPNYWYDNPTDLVKQTYDSLQTKTVWKLQLILPFEAKNAKALNSLISNNKNIEVRFINYVVFKGFNVLGNFLYTKNIAMPQSQNVLVACLFAGINIGFKKLYLTGADHTWHENLHVNENNDLCLKDIHFYENKEQVKYRMFYKDSTQTLTFKMHEILATLSKSFYGYINVNNYAKYRNVSIYNASEISFIDAFERKKLDTLC
ncbi:MAG: hypothetical protein H7331_01525 [Bacteroidia bacterium]|nr:hypothetical protein [Bacteroidia bacterium]